MLPPALLCLLVLGCLQAQAALFTQLPTPPWAPRILQGLAFPTASLTLNSVTYQPGSTLLAWGGSLYNDTYVSSDSGNTWTLVGGVGASANGNGGVSYTASPHPAAFTPDDTGACKRYDALKNEFYVLDETYAWSSSNGIDWAKAAAPEYAGRTSAACLVDTQSNLYVIGGQNTSSKAYDNDIWGSSSLGQTFAPVTTAPWSQRDSMGSFANNYPVGKVLTAIGGHAKVEDFRPNEVWASSDSAKTWRLLTKAPFIGRDHFTTLTTPNNIIVVVAGKNDVVVPAGHLGMNDVWASADGGYTWGQCSSAAEFPLRQDATLAIDGSGYLYIAGGTSNTLTGATSILLNDMWKSTISFTNVNSVMSTCFGGAAVPGCSLGLRCWPNATTIVMNTSASTPYPIPTAAPYSCPCIAPLTGGAMSQASVSLLLTIALALLAALCM